MIKSRKTRRAGSVPCRGNEECGQNFGWKAWREGNRQLETLLAYMENNIKPDLRKIGWEDVNRIHLAQNREQWRALLGPKRQKRHDTVKIFHFASFHTINHKIISIKPEERPFTAGRYEMRPLRTCHS
jgi:hypothetical protein